MTQMRLRENEEILEFGKREFHLKPLNLNDMIEGEEEHGLDFTKMGPGDIKLKSMRTIFFLLIKKAVPEGEEPITIEWVGEHLDITDKETIGAISNFIAPGAESPKHDG